MNCSTCGHENRDGAKFCEECGTPAQLACGSCGNALRAGAKFCDDCGAATGTAARSAPAPPERSPADYTPKHLADRILRSKSALEGERKQVTVMFADVARSMELAEELDPEAWHQILDRFFEVLAEGVHRFEGTVNQYTGDGIMALFGAPVAHEDHAHRACFAALHMREAIREYAREVRTRHGVPFGVRIGLNSGEVVVGKIGDDLRMDYTAQGHVVGLAQRMESLAESGSIHLSEHTEQIVRGYFELEDQGAVKVKGVGEPVGLFELSGVGPHRTRLDRSRARGLSMFVGRDHEMDVLDKALEDAEAGRARIVGVVADAGVGKSRLCAEFIERCRAKDISVEEAHCPAHGRTIPLLPVREMLRSYFGVQDEDPARIARERIAGRLLLLNRDLEAHLPLVWELMGVPDPERPVGDVTPEARERRQVEVIQSVVRLRSQRELVVFLIDDLHWIDAASDTFIAQLIEAVHGTRTLIVANFRPEYRADWMQRRDYLQLPLSPLEPDAIRKLLATLLGDDPSVAGLPELIHERAAGNPFFTEEVVQSLIESGQLQGERGAFQLMGPVERVEIPDTVQTVLAARIDRLEDLEKRVLQTAAVIDKDFARPVLGEIAEIAEADLDASLRALCDADLLYQRELYPVVEYSFKHPLTHEVAYASQLGERRRSLHASLARVLESADDSQPSLLAHHWDEAGENEPAVHWHRYSAEELGFVAQAETLRHWRRVSELLEQMEETHENLVTAAMARAQILWIMLRNRITPEEAEKLYSEALVLAERTGESATLSGAHRAYGTYLLLAGQPGCGELVDEAVRDADRSGDPATQVAARYSASWVHVYTGRNTRGALLHAEEGLAQAGDDLELGADHLGFSPKLMTDATRSLILCQLGRLDEARAGLDRLLPYDMDSHPVAVAATGIYGAALAERLDDPAAAMLEARRMVAQLEKQPELIETVVIGAHFYIGVAHRMNGRWDDAISAIDEALSRSEAGQSMLMMGPEMRMDKARVLVEMGQRDQARALLDEAVESARKQELGRGLAAPLLCRAELRALGGDASPEEILSDIDEAAGIVDSQELIAFQPDVHEARAALAALRGDPATRKRELERARDLAQDMGAPLRAKRIAALLD